MASEVLVEAHGVTRRYPGVVALSDVSIAVKPGAVHVIAGENGAGKSTLVKILTGTVSPSEGEIRVLGRSVDDEPELFKRIGYVPQELNLFPHLTVAENLFMPFELSGFSGAILDSGRLAEEARKQLERFSIHGRPDQQVRELSVSDQQLLMIARACAHRALDVLILDEPTSSLTVSEIERLFGIIRTLRAEGKGIVFISHKSEEVFEIGDEISVLRNGELVGHYPVEGMDEGRLLALMAGREVKVDENFYPSTPPGDVVLDVRGLSGVDFEDVSFTLRRGEILGFAGLVGAGRSEVMQTIFGFLPRTRGEVTLAGEPLRLGAPSRSVKAGLVYLSEERKQHGIFPMQSLMHNIGITLLRRDGGHGAGFDRQGAQGGRGDCRAFRRQGAVAVAAHPQSFRRQPAEGDHWPGAGDPAQGPHPRRADARHRRQNQGRGLPHHQGSAERGIGVIVISSEMLELRRCATRIICLHAGRVQGEFDSRTCSNEELVTAIFGKTRENS